VKEVKSSSAIIMILLLGIAAACLVVGLLRLTGLNYVEGREATAQDYHYVARLLNEGDEPYSRCPALKMDAARALADGKLTVGEVKDLTSKAESLEEKSKLEQAKNEALEAAGHRGVRKAANCPWGSIVFYG
jgi:hypothetical protein